MEKQILDFRFAAEDKETVETIVNSLAELSAASAYKNYGEHGVIEEVVLNNYDEKRDKIKEAILKFAANKAGIPVPETATDMAYAMDNTAFRDILNTINTRTIRAMMVRYTSPQLDRLVEIDNVGVGGSKTYEIDTKSLPIAQPATYGSNVSMVPAYAMGSITVTPKSYTIGMSLDFIRIIANGYDWGRAIARIYAGMIFAQYKLSVGRIFDSSVLNGTPLYAANFSAATYTQLASDVGMLNGGAGVIALGTLVAWQAIGALATQGGFTTKDEYIRNAYLQKIYGVDSMILDQITNLAAPFTTANASSLRAIPDNMVVVAPEGEDKLVKLVREDYIRVIETPANNNTLNRNEYTYFQNFDAKLATGSYFGLQSTTQG